MIGRISRAGAAQARRPQGRRLGQPGPVQEDGPAARRSRSAAQPPAVEGQAAPTLRRGERQRPRCPTARRRRSKGSNFEQLKRLGVLDAKTHKFAEAWKAGYAGEGVDRGVLDGGTDWGHPDLIGTWQTWSGADGHATSPTTAGTAGRRRSTRTARCSCSWPRARSTAACRGTRRRRRRRCPGPTGARASVHLRARGPARRATSARRPASTSHTYTLPAQVDEVGQRAPRQPPRRLPARHLRRAPGVPRRRLQEGRRLRHGLRRPRRRPQTSPTRSRSRRPRPRPTATWTATATRTSPAACSTTSPTARRRSPAAPVFGDGDTPGAGRAARVDRRLRPGHRGPRHADGVQRRRPGRDQRQGAAVRRPPAATGATRAPSSAARRTPSSPRTATSTSASTTSTQLGYLLSTATAST